jgi:hypothetical protein
MNIIITFLKKIRFVLLNLPKHISVLSSNLLRVMGWGVGFKYTLAMVAIIKNEAPYIIEWIEYHRIVGVNKFYIYDNESNDGVYDILKKYISTGLVEYKYYPGTGVAKQIEAYNEAIRFYKNDCKWMAFIDIDEFVVPLKFNNIPETIDYIQNSVLKQKFFGLAIHWVCYGYSGHREKIDGLVTENFTKSDGLDRVVKSIINPRAVVKEHVHFAEFIFKNYCHNEKDIQIRGHLVDRLNDSQCDFIRINHYQTKSYEEYTDKIERNKKWHPGLGYQLPDYDPNYYSHFDDFVMKPFIPAIKTAMEKQ